MIYPNSLTAEGNASRLADFCNDLRGKSIEEIRYGCRRYRMNPENRFFPTPGQLIEACKNPFDTKERKYEPLSALPTAMPEQDARALIEKIRVKYNVRDPDAVDMVAIKEEILSRPKLPYVETPEDVKRVRAEALERRLAAVKHYGRPEQ